MKYISRHIMEKDNKPQPGIILLSDISLEF
jgi:hypothetical protein